MDRASMTLNDRVKAAAEKFVKDNYVSATPQEEQLILAALATGSEITLAYIIEMEPRPHEVRRLTGQV